MTEQEYINRGDLVRVTCALEILRGIVLENSPIISKDEFRKVGEILYGIQNKLFAETKITTQAPPSIDDADKQLAVALMPGNKCDG